MRRAAKRDANEETIVVALRAAGCLVQQLTQGDGVPDLLVWSPALLRLLLIEVKDLDDTKAKKPNKLRKSQEDWLEEWKAAGSLIAVVTTPSMALLAAGFTPKTYTSQG